MTEPNYIELRGVADPELTRFRWRDPELHPRQATPDAPFGLFAAEGDLVVERALNAGYRLAAVLADVTRRPSVLARIPDDVPVFVADPEVRRVMTGLSVTLDVIGLFHRVAPSPPTDVLVGARRLAVMQQVDNPTNLGSIVRSAVALGVDGILVDRTSADPLARRCVRVSMGTVFAVPFGRIGDLPDGLEPLQSKGFRLLALTPDPDATPIDRISLRPHEPAALLLGSERAGLSPEVLAVCEPVTIPMRRGVDSLNVAAAAAIAFYSFGAG